MIKKISLGLLILLTGCTGTKDPREANLFDSMVNLNSGEYEQQSRKDREELNFAVDERSSVQSKTKRLKSTQKDLDAERYELRASLYAMEDDIEDIENQIMRIQSSTQTTQQKKRQVQKRLKQVKRQISSLKNNSNNIAMQKYRQRKKALQQEIESLVRLLAEM